MTSIRSPRRLYEEATSHLASRPEQVGFFLADFDAETQTFQLTAWRPVHADGYEYQGDYHVRLSDETQTEMIQWATRENGCLVEAHSHGDLVPAAFSPSDLAGFVEWVPHCSWRLRRRPYAAIVTAADEFDALAWINDPKQAEQIRHLALEDGAVLNATRCTLQQPRSPRPRR